VIICIIIQNPNNKIDEIISIMLKKMV